MRDRIIGSVLVVAVGLAAILLGGPAFALVMTGLGILGYRELMAMFSRVAPIDPHPAILLGATIILLFALAALFRVGSPAHDAIVVLAVFAPLLLFLRQANEPGAISAWSLVSVGSLYLGLPIGAAITLRSFPGAIDVQALTGMSDLLAWGWESAPRGMAWVLTVVLATWIGDSAAYLVGRAIGSRKLAPVLSPNKTIEGAIGGLLGSIAVSAMAFATFGLGGFWQGAIVGGVLGLAGQAGDLGESFLKRQSGVKDSGSLIPGHGGVLDRSDALLFAFPAGYLLAAAVERYGG